MGIAQGASVGQSVLVRLLGEFAITAGERTAGPWPRPSARRLCALLLVSPGHRVSRDLACEELFPNLEPRAAARSLSKALSMARAALAELGEPGEGLLGADLVHLWLTPGVTVDVDNLTAALRAALALSPGDERDAALAAALESDEEILPGEPYADWADRAREQLNALRQEARLALARDRAKGFGRSGRGDVTAAWLASFDHDPASEEAAGALIRLYAESGQQTQALVILERCRVALEELGLRTSPSLMRLYAAAMPEPAPASARTPAPAPQPGLREERRPVTMLFAEVAAPTDLAARLGLEALRDYVGGSLAAVITEVESLGGTVTSVSGRGLQAMFGAPRAHEDDPERALRAAYRAMSAASRPDGPGLRIGIESGPALVGPIGGGPSGGGTAKTEYLALGDVVSTAAALQAAARPGTILVGPATRAVTAHLFRWGAREELPAGPEGRPRAASYLDAPLATATGKADERRPGLGGSAPLVGRNAELRLVEQALRAAVAGRGQLVLLTGEPGIGKTRLVAEARNRFIGWVGAGSGRQPLWLAGRGVSYASATPYSVYRYLLSSWLDVPLDQPPAALRSALADALTSLMGNTNLLRPLAYLMGLPETPEPGPAGTGGHPPGEGRDSAPDTMAAFAIGRPVPGAHAKPAPEEIRRQVFAAMRALAARFAAVAPTVLVLEDLHWADPTSLRLTAELAELAQGRRLLLLAATRPTTGRGVSGQAPGSAGMSMADALGAREIRLRPLPPDAATALTRSLIDEVGGPDVPGDVLSAVLGGTGGNPLFVEERLAGMLDGGTLVQEQGRWRLRLPVNPAQPQVEVPQVLERLIRSRVDRLSPPAADAIRAAAVLGPEFTTDLLAATLGITALAPLLKELQSSDLVHPEPHGSQGPVFRFRHALLQEMIALTLLRAERRDLHARAARALSAATVGMHAEVGTVLGRHYALAEDPVRAVRYLELGGDHATESFANDEAVEAFREALAVTEQVGGDMAADAVRLQVKLANVLWRTARRREAGAAFRAALRLADAGPRSLDSAERAHLHTRLGRLEMAEGRFGNAAEEFDAAEALLGGDIVAGNADDAVVSEWLELMIDGRASLFSQDSELDKAQALLECVRSTVEARGAPERKSAFHRMWTYQRVPRNRWRVDDEDVAMVRASVAEAEQASEERDKDIGYATECLGWVLWLHGDLTEAAEQLAKSLALADRIGEPLLRDVSLRTLCLVELSRGDVEAVRALLPRSLAAAKAAHRRDYGHLAGGLAIACWLAWQDGRPDEVLRLAAEIEAGGSSSLSTDWVYLFPALAARLHVGEVAAAVTAARQIIDPSQQWLPDDLTGALAAAGDAWAAGDAGQTAAHLTRALDLATAHSYF